MRRRPCWWFVFALVGCGRAEPVRSAVPPPPAASAPAYGPARAGGLTWDSAPPLRRRAERTQLRAAEYSVDGEPAAELLVFYFGSEQVGSVEANAQRWLAQFEQPDGSDSAQKARRGSLQLSGLAVSTLEVRGIYTGPLATSAAPAPAPATESTLLGAIAAGPRGPVFFKLTGPTPGVERARDAFERLLRSLRPE